MPGYIPNEREAVMYILSLVISMLALVTAVVVFIRSNNISETILCEQVCYPNKQIGLDTEKQKCICDMSRMYKDIK